MALDCKTQGIFSWNELMTTDVEAAKAFYGKLFGWTYDDMPISEGCMAGSTYAVAKVQGESAAGLMGTVPGQNMPPMWGAYVTVTSIDQSLAETEKLGGKVLVPKTPIPGMGFFAVIADPQGAGLGIFEFGA